VVTGSGGRLDQVHEAGDSVLEPLLEAAVGDPAFLVKRLVRLIQGERVPSQVPWDDQ
jgi:hypothetical protein